MRVTLPLILSFALTFSGASINNHDISSLEGLPREMITHIFDYLGMEQLALWREIHPSWLPSFSDLSRRIRKTWNLAFTTKVEGSYNGPINGVVKKDAQILGQFLTEYYSGLGYEMEEVKDDVRMNQFWTHHAKNLLSLLESLPQEGWLTLLRHIASEPHLNTLFLTAERILKEDEGMQSIGSPNIEPSKNVIVNKDDSRLERMRMVFLSAALAGGNKSLASHFSETVLEDNAKMAVMMTDEIAVVESYLEDIDEEERKDAFTIDFINNSKQLKLPHIYAELCLKTGNVDGYSVARESRFPQASKLLAQKLSKPEDILIAIHELNPTFRDENEAELESSKIFGAKSRAEILVKLDWSNPDMLVDIVAKEYLYVIPLIILEKPDLFPPGIGLEMIRKTAHKYQFFANAYSRFQHYISENEFYFFVLEPLIEPKLVLRGMFREPSLHEVNSRIAQYTKVTDLSLRLAFMERHVSQRGHLSVFSQFSEWQIPEVCSPLAEIIINEIDRTIFGSMDLSEKDVTYFKAAIKFVLGACSEAARENLVSFLESRALESLL